MRPASPLPIISSRNAQWKRRRGRSNPKSDVAQGPSTVRRGLIVMRRIYEAYAGTHWCVARRA